jgi:hypothetical protein
MEVAAVSFVGGVRGDGLFSDLDRRNSVGDALVCRSESCTAGSQLDPQAALNVPAGNAAHRCGNGCGNAHGVDDVRNPESALLPVLIGGHAATT